MFNDSIKALRFLKDTIDNCKSAIYESGNSDLEDYVDRLENAYGVVYDEFDGLKDRCVDLEEEIKNLEHEIRLLSKRK